MRNNEFNDRNYNNPNNNMNNNMQYNNMDNNMQNMGNNFNNGINNIQNNMGNIQNNMYNNNYMMDDNGMGNNNMMNNNINNQMNQQMNANFNNQIQSQNQLPMNNNYQIIRRGNGLNNNEVNIIIQSTCEALNNEEDPLSKGIIKRVKKIVGGDWVVFACVNGLKGYDLSISTYDDDKLISYYVDSFKFEVIKIRD